MRVRVLEELEGVGRGMAPHPHQVVVPPGHRHHRLHRHHHHRIQAGCYAGWAGASRPPDSEAKHRGAGRGEEAGADHGEKVARLQGLHQTKGWKEENPTVVFIFRDRTTMSLHLYRKSLLLLRYLLRR